MFSFSVFFKHFVHREPTFLRCVPAVKFKMSKYFSGNNKMCHYKHLMFSLFDY